MFLRNVNPLGAVDLPLIGRTLDAGEVFEVADELAGCEPTGDELGCGLLAQVGNYERADVPAAAPAAVEAPATTDPAADEAAPATTPEEV